MSVQVDERGRILLPKHLRERFGLVPGRRLRIEAMDDGIIIQAETEREDVLKRLRGAIHEDNQEPRAAPLDPLDAKKIWESGP